jgi:murein DD-endopeptidase MepM/ murein hydrolase activator NlpD
VIGWARRLAAASVTMVALLTAAPNPASAIASPSPSPSSAPSAAPSATPAPTRTPAPTASATPSPAGTPTPTAAPAAVPARSPSPAASLPTAVPAPTPCAGPSTSGCGVKLLVAQVKQRLGDTMARSLVAQAQLSDALTQNARQQQDLRAQVEDSRLKAAKLQAEIQVHDAEIKATQARIDLERAEIGRLARAEYEQPDSTLVRLLRSGSLKGWLVGASDLAAAARRGQQLQNGLEQDLAQLNQEQSTRQSDLEQLTGLQAQQKADLQKLQALGRQQQQTAGQLAAKIAATKLELKNVDRQQPALADSLSQALDAEVTQIIDFANQQAWSDVQLSLQSDPVQAVVQTAAHSTQSRFIWPMPKGQISQGFGPSQLSFEPAFAGFAHFHTGVDIAGPENDPVLAADDGRVVQAVSGSSGYGNYVVLGHANGVTTLYGHLNQILVRPGDQVRQGDTLGLEGSTGYSTGPHVHFEVRLNGVPVDPLNYLPAGPPSPIRA